MAPKKKKAAPPKKEEAVPALSEEERLVLAQAEALVLRVSLNGADFEPATASAEFEARGVCALLGVALFMYSHAANVKVVLEHCVNLLQLLAGWVVWMG